MTPTNDKDGRVDPGSPLDDSGKNASPMNESRRQSSPVLPSNDSGKDTKPTNDDRGQTSGTDLLLIVLATGVALGAITVWGSGFNSFVQDPAVPVLLRTLVGAFAQFGVAGLGITIVSLWRKESFLSYGLKRRGALQSILLCVLAYVPSIAFSAATGRLDHGYLPFQAVWMTKDVLASGFPTNAVGMLIIVTAWGFFEGFNYVVISDKINAVYPSKNKWLNWGAISCALICLLIHGLVGVTFEGILEAATVFIIIYGMLMAKEHTGNAWGCVFIFVFLWNAF